jgi:formylglycine-generating enzyme required for sulfatase activity
MLWAGAADTDLGDGTTVRQFYGEHTVNISSFLMGETEVTQGLWETVMGSNPSNFNTNTELPVEQVSWYDIVGYGDSDGSGDGTTTQTGDPYNLSNIGADGYPSSSDPSDLGYTVAGIYYYKNGFMYKLSDLADDNIANGSVTNASTVKFCLPSESQWEYAARGGNDHEYDYAGSDNLDDVCWIDDATYHKTHEVSQKVPNGYGLYDMSGNVWEWCADWLNVYPFCGISTNYVELEPYAFLGSPRVLRGGSWSHNASYCRVSYRYTSFPSTRDSNPYGFRLAFSSVE